MARLFYGFVFPALLCALVSACATVQSLQSPTSDYRSYVEARLEIRRVFDRGNQIFAAQALGVTPELVQLQEKLLEKSSTPADPDKRVVIVALNNFNSARFLKSDMILRLGGRDSIKVTEIYKELLLRQTYFFAFPHYRVFIAEFPASAATDEELEVSKVTFKVTLPVHFAPEGVAANGAD